MKTIQKSLRELLRYPSAAVGLTIILVLVGVSVYAIISIPYNEAVRLWRGGEGIWYKNPKYAQPEWTNWFRKEKLPKSLILDSRKGEGNKTVGERVKGTAVVTLEFSFDYSYGQFPQEMALYFHTQYTDKKPHVAITWITPDGRTIPVSSISVGQTEVYRFAQDTKLTRQLGGLEPQEGLFVADPAAGKSSPVKGTYTVHIEGLTFEEGSDLDAEFVLYGKVCGWAGTDHLRRNLGVALLWGAPIAMAFGLLAALGTTITTMTIAAFGVWFGGWVDEIIQRITEVNMVLPFLPILIMVGTFYSRSIWVILGVTILLSIFGAAIKTYRATFLQIKESPYIEAARSYGAGGLRIIFLYLTPRLIPMIIPGLVFSIPAFVFLEASLAVLGLGDPILPTWGKIISDAEAAGALYQGLYYWILEPATLLMISGLAFAFVGFSLDRIFNPRLRGL